MNKKTRKIILSSYDERTKIKSLLLSSYYSLFFNSKEWEGIGRDERIFIMRQLWENGSVACISIPGDPRFPAFCPFAPSSFNLYLQPARATPIRLNDARFIPTRNMVVYKEGSEASDRKIVIGYALPDKKPVKDFVEEKINEMVNIRMTMRTNLYSQKLSLLYAVTPENKDALEEIISDLFNDELSVAIEADDVNSIQGLKTPPSFLLDKLSDSYRRVEGELLTFLGIDNNSVEKRERALMDEVNANNDLINEHSEALLDGLQAFTNQINECFGFNVSVKNKFQELDASVHEELNDEEGGENDEENNA